MRKRLAVLVGRAWMAAKRLLERLDLIVIYEDERYRVHLDEHGRVIAVTDLYELRERRDG